MIILDTNVVSEFMNDPPDGKVVGWLDRQARASIWTSSITLFEIQAGLVIVPAGNRRNRLELVFEAFLNDIDHRIAVFDEESARAAAGLTAQRQKRGRPRELRDTMIAGIVLSRHASLATRNVSHFDDISAAVVNPWA